MESIEQTKVCSGCGEPKLLSEFAKHKSEKDGLQRYCRSCYSLYYQTHREEICSRVRQNSADNHEEHLRREQERRISAPELFIAQRKRFRILHPERILVANAKDRAKKYGIPFSITEDDIHIPEICPILGLRLERVLFERSDSSPSLDRIVPELGYTSDNIAIISDRANRLKNNGTSEEHRRISEWMTRPPEHENRTFVGEFSEHMGMLVRAARKRAKNSGISCTISVADVPWRVTCPILGIPIRHDEGKISDNSPSLDRRDPEQGYTSENVCVVSWRANRIKNNGTAAEHRLIADWIDKQLSPSI